MNPIQAMMKLNQSLGQAPAQTAPGRHEARQPINPAVFQRCVGGLSDKKLEALVAQARQQGISEDDIQSGLQMISKMR